MVINLQLSDYGAEVLCEQLELAREGMQDALREIEQDRVLSMEELLDACASMQEQMKVIDKIRRDIHDGGNADTDATGGNIPSLQDGLRGNESSG